MLRQGHTLAAACRRLGISDYAGRCIRRDAGISLRTGSPQTTTAAQDAEILRLQARGITQQAIADQIGVSRSVVQYRVKLSRADQEDHDGAQGTGEPQTNDAHLGADGPEIGIGDSRATSGQSRMGKYMRKERNDGR
jgi:transposase-like protein